jgi:hypothetical protein
MLRDRSSESAIKNVIEELMRSMDAKIRNAGIASKVNMSASYQPPPMSTR